ncbi:MAG: TetR/AcrR family transcriptional regulator [Solirubrobacteraceae bacterium]
MVKRRGPGRPRSEASRQAILAAALGLAAQLGYAAVTIERIAARAGVGKQTIYRWWPTKADVLLEAGRQQGGLAALDGDHGSYAADLEAFLNDRRPLAGHADGTGLLRALIAEAQLDREFGERFRADFLEAQRQALAALTDRARRRGDLPPQPDATTVAGIVLGTIWYGILAGDQPFDDGHGHDLVALLSGTRAERPRPLTVHPRAAARRAPLPWRAAAETDDE